MGPDPSSRSLLANALSREFRIVIAVPITIATISAIPLTMSKNIGRDFTLPAVAELPTTGQGPPGAVCAR